MWRFDSAPRFCGRLASLAWLLLLAGCASSLDVRPLATGRGDQSAFELTGRDLDALRREAGQLCPDGGEILRQTARDQRLEAIDSRMERWAHFSSLWITPPERHAQMVVLCKPVADRHLLTALSAKPPSARGLAAAPEGAASAPGGFAAVAPVAPVAPFAPVAPVAPAAPIGPVSVEW
jgi:hypothetical protein